VRLGERLGSLEHALREAELADKKAIAAWQVAGETGARPAPTMPALEAELAEVRADIDSMAIAEDSILKEKVEYVAKHRKNLVADAAKGRTAAVARLRKAIAVTEEARAEVLEALRAEAWAKYFPREEANPDSFGLQLIRGGRVSKALPELRTITTAASLFAYLLDDAAWLDAILADTEEDRPLDPHERAIWEQTPEGQKAMALANKRVAMGLRPRAVHAAEWERP
jgi:hypothetical protein